MHSAIKWDMTSADNLLQVGRALLCYEGRRLILAFTSYSKYFSYFLKKYLINTMLIYFRL